MSRFAAAILCLALLPAAAAAEVELSFYTGIQESPHSIVTGTDPSNPVSTDLDFTAGWEGNSFAPPPYWGARATWWRSETFGLGVEFTHDKVYGDDETLAANGFDTLEFTDGLNILTVNGVYRWPDRWGVFTPYVGGGLGVSIPHVEIESGGNSTIGYQLTGPAMRLFAGAKYDLNDRWSLFGEYQGTYSVNEADITGGGTLKTNIITNALNAGVAFSF